MVKDTILYDILGISPTISTSEIEKLYKNYDRQVYPNKEFIKAYEILSNNNIRQLYDKVGVSGINTIIKRNGAKYLVFNIIGGITIGLLLGLYSRRK